MAVLDLAKTRSGALAFGRAGASAQGAADLAALLDCGGVRADGSGSYPVELALPLGCLAAQVQDAGAQGPACGRTRPGRRSGRRDARRELFPSRIQRRGRVEQSHCGVEHSSLSHSCHTNRVRTLASANSAPGTPSSMTAAVKRASAAANEEPAAASEEPVAVNEEPAAASGGRVAANEEPAAASEGPAAANDGCAAAGGVAAVGSEPPTHPTLPVPPIPRPRTWARQASQDLARSRQLRREGPSSTT